MTKVDFYTGSTDKLRTACQLSHKAMQNRVPVMLHAPDEATASALDKLLWHFPATAFLPHCFSHETAATEMPIVVDWQGTQFPHHHLLISLHHACVPFFSRFERVIEIVGTGEEEVQAGRQRFAFYRDRGYEIRHFDLQAANGNRA
jgi:DNA polymerase-3 subunit chi